MMKIRMFEISPLFIVAIFAAACGSDPAPGGSAVDAGDASMSPDSADISLDLSPTPDTTADDSGAEIAPDVTPDAAPNSCDNSPIGPPPEEPRQSSFQDCAGGATNLCDGDEACDFIHYDLLCDGECVTPGQTGDQRCHRICGDGVCAEGERCESRPVYESDTPTIYVDMCVCDGADCPVLGPGGEERPVEGGISHWRSETPMPADLYYHAAAVGGGYLYVSGGLTIAEISPDGNGASLDRVAAIYGASIGADGQVETWLTAGELPEPRLHHAMAILGDRLFVAGGEGSEGMLTDVVSAEIRADGRLGEWRNEAPLDDPRGWHTLLAADDLLIVAGGSTSAHNFTTGTNAIAYAEVDSEGRVSEWRATSAPDQPAYNSRAAVADGRLFLVGETDNVYSVDIDDLDSPSWLVELERFDGLAATQLVGLCDSVVAIGEAGRAWIAPLGDYLGQWRLATRFYGTGIGFAIAVAESGRIYVTGGTAGRIPIERVDAVWSTSRN